MTASPNQLASALLASPILPRVPSMLSPPQVPSPTRVSQLSLGPLIPAGNYGATSGRMWSIVDSTGAQTGVLHKPSTPFSTWNVLIGPSGQSGQQYNFNTKAQALAYMGITE